MLATPSLRGIVKPISQALTEPAHTLYIGGVCNTIVFLFFEAVYKSGVGQICSQIRTFIDHWRWPTHVSSKGLYDAFSPNRVDSWRKARHFKSSASELMSLMPVLTYFVLRYMMPSGICPLASRAFIAVADMCEAFTLRRTNAVSCAHAQGKVRVFMAACVAAGWADSMHAKFHWLIHLAKEVVLFGLTPERKHIEPKTYAKDRRNLTSYDLGVLANCTGLQLARMRDPDTFAFAPGLTKPRKAPKHVASVMHAALGLDPDDQFDCEVSLQARLPSLEICQARDIVLLDGGHGVAYAAEVHVLCACNGVQLALLSCWTTMLSSSRDTGSCKWQRELKPEVWDLERLLCNLISRSYDDGVVTLIPPLFRHMLP